jgi:hypothetical protein
MGQSRGVGPLGRPMAYRPIFMCATQIGSKVAGEADHD